MERRCQIGAKNTLTDRLVRSATEGSYWDAALSGFGLRVGKNRKTFVVLVDSGRRKSIGQWPEMSLATARAEARKLLAEKTLGRVLPKHVAFEDARDAFLKDCETRLRPQTLTQYRHQLMRHFPLGRRSVADVSPRQIVRLLNDLNHVPSQKEHAARVGKTFFQWCVRQHIIDRSPMEHVANPVKGGSRERVLTDQELQALLLALQSDPTPYKRLVELLLLTGQRRGEIAGLQWSWLDREGQTIIYPPEATKNNRRHVLPYGDRAAAVFASIPHIDDSPYLFPASRDRRKGESATILNGWGRYKTRLDKEVGFSDWTLHDIRRTFSSGMAAMGIQQVVVEKLLNHVSGGSQSPIAQVYNRHQY